MSGKCWELLLWSEMQYARDHLQHSPKGIYWRSEENPCIKTNNNAW